MAFKQYKNKMKADLHMHSNFSDGELSVADLAKRAYDAGCEIVALTDHDTVSGVQLMNYECEKLGIKNITGIEISTQENVEIHILGYNFDINSSKLQQYFKFIYDLRTERVKKMLELLADYKMHISDSDIFINKSISVARNHIAKQMVLKGYEKDVQTCFNKWLGAGRPCFVAHVNRPPLEAITAIKQAGGVSVLAHPVRLDLSLPEKAELVKNLASCGLDGIESVYANSSKQSVSFFKGLARRYKLFNTVGGDFHYSTDEFMTKELDKQVLNKLGIEYN